MSRTALIAGNWKMHTTQQEARALALAVAASHTSTDRDVLLAPPFTALETVAKAVGESSVLVGAQNVCWAEHGAFTGEISPVMLKELGVSAAIIGHSERRQIFGESDELINKRVVGALDNGLAVILCIGETLQEREDERTLEVLQGQVRGGLDQVPIDQMDRVVLAYEPVWAIGTGKTASKDQAQEAHAYIRSLIEVLYEKDVADDLRILYGGSVKPTNVDELMAQPDIDGALVGGAALDAESFGRIINFR